MRFFDDSKADFEAEQKAKEEARKREFEQAKALAKAEKQRADIQRKSAKRNKVLLFSFRASRFAIYMAQAEADCFGARKLKTILVIRITKLR